MSEGVRQRIAVTNRSHRRLEQRLLVRFPRFSAFLVRAVWRPFSSLPPRSRLRREGIRHALQQGFEATNRRDLEAAFALYRADVESIWPPQLRALGFEPAYRGRDARIEAQRRWLAEWDDLRFELEEAIDLGDRLLLVTRMQGSGLASGAGGEIDCVFVYTLGAGGVTREEFFLNRDEAFAAVGLAG